MSSVSQNEQAQAAQAATKNRPVSAASLPHKTTSTYPAAFKHHVQGRTKRAVGNHFGLTNFGVNHTTLAPGSSSALQHCHSKQDEFVYILQGTAVCKLDETEYELKAGDCMGFPALGRGGTMHCVVNKSEAPVVYLEIGDRTAGDVVEYAGGVDLMAEDGGGGTFKFVHKDGSPYDNDSSNS